MSSDIYAAPEVELETQSTDAEKATFLRRAGASLIDALLLFLVFIPLFVVLGVDGEAFLSSDPNMGLGVTGILVQYVLPLVITIAFWVTKGATPGKMITGIKIVDADSLEKPTMGKSIIRYIGYFISSIVFFLGFLWVIWDKKKQAWHDKMSNTYVIRLRK